MTTESQEATKREEPAAEIKADEPPAKKKRGAENQITKDDYDAGGDDDEAENDDRLKPNSFKRASEEVLAKRKIVKVRRTFGASSAPAAPTTEASADDKSDKAPAPDSSNPFAKTNFASPSSSSEPKKVFGFGSSSGFGAAKSSNNGSSGFGSSSSSGFGSSTSNGFGNGSSSGFAGVGSGGKSSGFGSGNATGFVFGSSKSSSNSNSKSLFGNAGASNISFSLSSTKAEDEKKDADKTQATKLPDKVELKTGEEDEKEIYHARCKSCEWIAVESTAGAKPADTNGENGNKGSPTKTNPSVQSSAQFQTAISSSKDADETKKEPEKAVNGDASTSSAEGAKHRWMELGIGPVKILQSKSNPERLRLVQRRESSKNGPATKVILNIPLW
eukprot:CAMPEP_0116130966 /NCGR_PEP_ID=MMETSP0329-20121206/8759_1 /TAXON_ID=697910 /ORGANISM="Pseudo-nitzschia arenysensis, Strain B593" /LENGTH=387 /DNA_ID=CAMNT_0003625375 /DNA_START=152 /DNA_END=1312 /DNA_ORIENTATION=-